MMKSEIIRLAIIGPAEIAIRRFIPALSKVKSIDYVGIGINTVSERYGKNLPSTRDQEEMLSRQERKAEEFVKRYGGIVFHSFEEVINNPEIDAVYIPLPPALHYIWARKALENNKHVLIEKPATINREESQKLIEIAKKQKVALHENYMFVYHKQLGKINEIINSGDIGDIRSYNIRFGFPRRSQNDFRYSKELGGGALLDAGGYTIRYATELLGEDSKVKYASLFYTDEFEVDIFGTGIISNDHQLNAHVSFGMDNDYKCELEVWGSKGTFYTGRVFTAPDGFIPEAIITINGEKKIVSLPEDDAFYNSIVGFVNCIKHDKCREEGYSKIMKQAEMVDEFRRLAS